MLGSIMLFLPEIILLVLSCFVLISSLFLTFNNQKIIYYTIQLTLVVMLCLLLEFSVITTFENSKFFFSFVFDRYSILIKMSITVFLFFIFVYTKDYTSNLKVGEYYFLCLFSTLGMFLLLSSNNLLVFYLSLELMSLPLYALIAMVSGYKTSAESSMKYFVLGSVASCILLFGISLLYGGSGCLNFFELKELLISNTMITSNFFVQCGCFFVLCGLVFKLGIAPFHVWVPDVYKGSSVAITLFISTIPKIAVFGIFYELVCVVLQPFYTVFIPIFIMMSILSLFIGNIFALAQKNIKRMFAYSSITNFGFVLLGLICYENSFIVSFFYLFIYTLTTLGSFALLLLCCRSVDNEFEVLDDFKGFGLKQPLVASVLLIFLLSMAGIPPLAGFYTKLLVLNSILDEGFIYLAIFSVLMSVVGLFYYLRVIKIMFFDSVEEERNVSSDLVITPTALRFNSGYFLLLVNGFLIVVIGVYPFPILKFCSFLM